MKFKTAYDPVEEHDHCGIEFTMPSLAVQDEKDETDINYIVNKYADGQKGIATLDLGDSSQYAYLQFGDATLPGDYSTALELVSGAAVFHQLVVRAALDNFSLIHYDDFIAVAYCRKSVRHNDAGYAPVFYGLHHIVFGFGVKRACRLVKNDDRRILRKHARDLHSLSLSAGKILSVDRQRAKRP